MGNLDMVIAFPVPAEMVTLCPVPAEMVTQRLAALVNEMQWQLNLPVLARQCNRRESMAPRQCDDQMSMENMTIAADRWLIDCWLM